MLRPLRARVSIDSAARAGAGKQPSAGRVRDPRTAAVQLRSFAGAPAVRWDPGTTLSDRQCRDHRRQLRGLALLRTPAPGPGGVPRLVLSLHGQQLLPWTRVL